MVTSGVRVCAWFEVMVMLFQVVGVAGLFLSRLAPGFRWAEWGKVGFVVALVGLGVAGAICGRHDSEFALFAGGTMTLLLIGMTAGSGQGDPTPPARSPMAAEAYLAG